MPLQPSPPHPTTTPHHFIPPLHPTASPASRKGRMRRVSEQVTRVRSHTADGQTDTTKKIGSRCSHWYDEEFISFLFSRAYDEATRHEKSEKITHEGG